MEDNKSLFFKLNYYYARFLQELSYRTGSTFTRPTSALILLTNRCNARCLHCNSWKIQPAAELSTEEWKKAFYELRRWAGPIFVSLTGGETLLRKDAVDLVAYAAQLGFWVELLTNGYLMNETDVNALVQSGVKRIKVSLDSSRSEIHDAVRGKTGFFEKATWALKSLAQKKNRGKRDIAVWAKTAIMNLNAEDLPGIARLCRDLGTGVEFQALEPVYYSEQLGDPDWYKNNPLWINDLEKLSGSIRRLKELKNQGYPIVNSLENLDLMEMYFKDPNALSYRIHFHDYKKKKKECRSWLGGLQIMPDGGMKTCHWMQPFGNIREGNIRTAWRNRVKCWKEPCRYVT